MQTVLEQGSIDKPLTFDVGLIQLSFIPVCSLNTCDISVKLCQGFALQCFSFKVYADFSASAATFDSVLNDGSSTVALMAVKTKEELVEQAIAIAPSAERGHC